MLKTTTLKILKIDLKVCRIYGAYLMTILIGYGIISAKAELTQSEKIRGFFSSPFPACLLKYCPDDIRKQLEENGTIIDKDEKYGLIENYAFLSSVFPVALLKENCPDNVRRLLEENGIFTDDFSRRCSCDEEVLKQYAPEYMHIIDDRKLLDGTISFDSWDFEIICSYYYTDPYDFDFYDII